MTERETAKSFFAHFGNNAVAVVDTILKAKPTWPLELDVSTEDYYKNVKEIIQTGNYAYPEDHKRFEVTYKAKGAADDVPVKRKVVMAINQVHACNKLAALMDNTVTWYECIDVDAREAALREAEEDGSRD